MSTLKRYKDLEKSFAKRLMSVFYRMVSAISAFFKAFMRIGRQKITIMLVPHTEKRILNLQISFFGLGAALALVLGLAGALAFAAAGYSGLSSDLAGKADALRTTQSDLDTIRDTTSRLVEAVRSFQGALDSALTVVGLNTPDSVASKGDGDLASFFEFSDPRMASLREVDQINRVSEYLERNNATLTSLSNRLASLGLTMSKIPSIWPIKDRLGHISMFYGQNENPIYGSWYIHKGIDISTYRQGDPVVATADGKVVAVAYDIGLGNYIIIEHAAGFLTRYAHLKAQKVQKGQVVQQGQVIGYIGNTGISTGPHLHYEIHMGTETVDPKQFIDFPPVPTKLTN